jgi:hypothetical protein
VFAWHRRILRRASWRVGVLLFVTEEMHTFSCNNQCNTHGAYHLNTELGLTALSSTFQVIGDGKPFHQRQTVTKRHVIGDGKPFHVLPGRAFVTPGHWACGCVCGFASRGDTHCQLQQSQPSAVHVYVCNEVLVLCNTRRIHCHPKPPTLQYPIATSP